MASRRRELTGQVFGQLTILAPYQRSHRNYWYWWAQCECGEVTLVNGPRTARGDITSCGCRQKKMQANLGPKYRLKQGKSGFNVLLGRYKYNAKKRGLSFELTEAQFEALTIRSCVYCGQEPNQLLQIHTTSGSDHGNYTYSGVDRRDNSIGYTMENSVPCCGQCNWAKGTLSEQEYVAWIKRAAKQLEDDDEEAA